MSHALIASQNAEITRLQRELEQTRQEAKARRQKSTELKAELATLQKQLADLTTDRDTWKTKAEASPGELQARVDDLTARLRTRDHRDAWARVVEAELEDKVTVEKLWREIDYKPGADVPTPEQITEQVTAAREAAPYLFKRADETSAVPAGPSPVLKPPAAALAGGVGGGRGGPGASSSRVTVKRSDYSDPDWMRLNQSRIAEAAKTESLVVLD